jgi:peroxiredoxin
MDDAWGAGTPDVGARAPDLRLFDEAGKPRQLSRLARGGPVLLLFFGAPTLAPGRALLREYRDVTLALRQAGVRPFGIARAEPPALAFLRVETGVSFPLLADPAGEEVVRFGMDGRMGVYLLDRKLNVLRRTREGQEAAEATQRFLRRGGAGPLKATFGERLALLFRPAGARGPVPR